MPKPLKRAIIVDLDGTLANCDHRVHHLQKSPKDWKSFYAGLDCDELNLWCLDLMNAMQAQGVISLIVTGRDEKYREETNKWLEKFNITYEQMYMREHGSLIEDSDIKKAIYNKSIKEKYDISFVLDDRLSVVKMWREIGLTCLQCDWGNF